MKRQARIYMKVFAIHIKVKEISLRIYNVLQINKKNADKWGKIYEITLNIHFKKRYPRF